MYRAKIYTSLFLAGKFLFVRSDGQTTDVLRRVRVNNGYYLTTEVEGKRRKKIQFWTCSKFRNEKKTPRNHYGSSGITMVISTDSRIYNGHIRFITVGFPASQTAKVWGQLYCSTLIDSASRIAIDCSGPLRSATVYGHQRRVIKRRREVDISLFRCTVFNFAHHGHMVYVKFFLVCMMTFYWSDAF